MELVLNVCKYRSCSFAYRQNYQFVEIRFLKLSVCGNKIFEISSPVKKDIID